MLTLRLRRLPNIVKSTAAAKVIRPPTVLSMPNSNLILEKEIVICELPWLELVDLLACWLHT